MTFSEDFSTNHTMDDSESVYDFPPKIASVVSVDEIDTPARHTSPAPSVYTFTRLPGLIVLYISFNFIFSQSLAYQIFYFVLAV